MRAERCYSHRQTPPQQPWLRVWGWLIDDHCVTWPHSAMMGQYTPSFLRLTHWCRRRLFWDVPQRPRLWRGYHGLFREAGARRPRGRTSAKRHSKTWRITMICTARLRQCRPRRRMWKQHMSPRSEWIVYILNRIKHSIKIQQACTKIKMWKTFLQIVVSF